MSQEMILKSFKKKEFASVYLLHGEEDYYIDLIMNYAENHILPDSEREFNLTIFYGRDTDWPDVQNVCKSYPMFGERRFVLLKEAQQMSSIDKLEPYLSSPAGTTTLIIGYKGKKLDSRLKIFKTLQKNAVIFLSEKIKDAKLGAWIANLVKEKGLTMDNKAMQLLEEHIGNDLSRLANEIDKLSINLNGKTHIEADDIEKYIGISKEYNVFELQSSIINKDFTKSLRIIQYFESNPKAVSIQMALPIMYASFSRTYSAYSLPDRSFDGIKSKINYFFAMEVKKTMDNYGFEGVQKVILLLHEYNLKSVGIRDSGTPGPVLLREMVLKLMQL